MTQAGLADESEIAHTTAVKLSVKSDYAARAVLELAWRKGKGRVCRAEELAMAVGTSANYLVQILLELKSAGLVRSVRGKQGGYLLERPVEEISLGDVLRAVDGSVLTSPALEDGQCPPVLRQAWGQLRDASETAADEVTFDRLHEDDARGREMYHI